MIRNHGQHASQIRLGVDAIQFRGAQEAIERGRTLATLIRPQKQEVLSPNGHASERAFCRIVVHLNAAIVQIPGERLPLVHGIADGIGGDGFPGERGQLFRQPVVQAFNDRPGLLLPDLPSFLGRLATYRCLNVIELANHLQHMGRDLGWACYMNVVELSSRMRPASSLGNLPRFKDRVEPRKMLCITFCGLCCAEIYVAALAERREVR